MSTGEQIWCPCGSGWFELKSDDSTHPNGAVALDERGIVIAFAGQPHCVECGERWQPARERLRAVQ
jgi:hypothetical protein